MQDAIDRAAQVWQRHERRLWEEQRAAGAEYHAKRLQAIRRLYELAALKRRLQGEPD